MAQIRQIGIGRKSNGTLDGISYVTRHGATYARAIPTVSASVYKTPEARKRQAIFTLVQMHLRHHLPTIKQTFTPKGFLSSGNRYVAANYKPLALALDTLADRMVTGELVTLSDVEAAIGTFAAENPQTIVIAKKNGYGEVYLTGAWPDSITLTAIGTDNTTVTLS